MYKLKAKKGEHFDKAEDLIKIEKYNALTPVSSDLPNFSRQEEVDDFGQSLTNQALKLKQEYLPVLQKPGLSLEIDDAVLRQSSI